MTRRNALGSKHTNVLVELPHEGNAELADLVVRLALGVEVASSLATAHVDCLCVSLMILCDRLGMTYGR